MTSAADGTAGGGGGFAVQLNGKVYFYDLLEAGLTDLQTLAGDSTDLMDAQNKLKSSDIPVEYQAGLIIKLNQIYAKLPSLAELLLEEINRFSWSFIPSKLIRPDDMGWSPIAAENGMLLRPAAVRQNRFMTVTVNRDLVLRMPKAHVVALIIHEAVRAISEDYGNNTSISAFPNRTFVALLFRPNFNAKSSEYIREQFAILVTKDHPLLSTEEYNRLHSPEYIRECSNIKKTLESSAILGLSALNEMIKSVESVFNEEIVKQKHWGLNVRLFDYYHVPQSAKANDFKNTFEINTFSFGNKTFWLPKQRDMVIFINPSVDGLPVSLSQVSIENFEQSQKDLLVLDGNIKQGFQSCLNEQERKAMEYVLTKQLSRASEK